MPWKQILPQLFRFEDSCNVYAVIGAESSLIIDAGTGYWLDFIHELPKPPAALLLTHYFRDHSAGAPAAARAGIAIYAPEGEKEIIADPGQHFRQRETYIIYDNVWDLFAPIEPAPLSGILRDYDKLEVAGFKIEVLPLPGVTLHQIGILLELGGKKLAFCGEAIHSPGRLARVAPLQYNYNDLGGAINAHTSARLLRESGAEVLLPGLGDPILENTEEALQQLQDSLRQLVAGRPGMSNHFSRLGPDPLEQITEHVWKTTKAQAFNYFLISRSGKVLAIDYGYDGLNIANCGIARPQSRRPILHSLETLRNRFGTDRIDVVLVSHFHDDHVCGIPLLQRLFQTECWAAENFAELLEHPEAHCFPCNWPIPLRIDRRLPFDEVFQWEEYTFRLHPMSGHTRFSALIGFEADRKRFAHTGDQYFFVENPTEPMRDYSAVHRLQNHVYRNGSLLDGYDQSGKWMLEWRPDIVIQGHRSPYFTNAEFFRQMENWAEEYKRIHQRAMVLSDNEPHFNLDSWGGWIWPYRTHLPELGPAKVRVTVRNPFPDRSELEVKLVGPAGWKGESAVLTAEGRAEVSVDLAIFPASACRRQPFAAELTARGRYFGQVAEALITVGHACF